jgi:hypothetical protein
MHENDIHRIIAAVLRIEKIPVPPVSPGHRDGIDDLAAKIMAAIDAEGFTYRGRRDA